MLNFRKRIFLFLTIIAVVLGLAACTESSNTVRINFDSEEYVVRMQTVVDVKPTIKAAASVAIDDIEVVYESSDESVVRYVNGVLYPKSEGEAEIKVYWKDKDVVFDKATVKVIKPALPVLVGHEGQQFLKNGEAQLAYTLHKNYTQATVKFESLNPEVATITESGVVSAVKVGTANIHAVVSDYEEVAEYYFAIEVIESDFAINYVLDGGVNAEGNPAGYNALETPLPIAAPTKVGYEFTGWTLDGQVVDAIPAGAYGDITLVATWKVVDYAVSYDLAGGEVAEGNPATYNVEQLPVALPLAPTKADYEFVGWTLNGEAVTEIPAGTVGEVKLVASWKAVDYAVSYDLAGGEVAEGNPATYNVEQLPVALPLAPTKAGYEFAGWVLGEQVVTEIPAGTSGEVKLVASWKVVKYSAVLNVNGGAFEGKYATREEMVADFIADFNAFAKAEITGAEQYWSHSQKTNFWKNAEMHAKWSWIFEALIPFAKAQGIDTQYLNNMLLETPSVSGYATQNVAIYLLGVNNNIWNDQYKLANGGLSSKWTTVDCTSDEVKDSWKAYVGVDVSYTVEDEVELPVPARKGYTFLGWYEGETKVEKIAKGTAKDVTVEAKWEIERYSITYELDGGVMPGRYATREELVADFLADYNAHAGKSHTAETFAELGSWSEISTASTFLYKEAYRAKWAWLVDHIASVASAANKHAWEVFNNFDAQSGLNAENGNNIYCIAYELRGFIGGIQYTKNANFKTADYSDATINAGWEAYAGMSGSYTVEDEVVLPVAVKDGKVFAGWYAGETLVEKVNVGSTGDLVLTAKWEEIVYSNITYVLDGGVNPENAPAQYQERVGVELPVPTKVGYKFLGWYIGETLVESIDASQRGDVELTAKWFKLDIKHTITYELDGGVNAEGAAAEYVEGVGYTLPVPTKEGYKFVGWTLAADSTDYIEAISDTANTDVTVYAHWREVVEGVVFVGENLDYATLDEAVVSVEDGTKIMLAAGEYALTVAITKSVEIIGPNAGLAATAERAAEAVITVTAGVYNLNAKRIVFNGVQIKGKSGANNAGVYFQNGGAPEYVEFVSCSIIEMNTVVKSTTGSNPYELVFRNNHISKVGQFIVWTTNATVKTLLVGNYVDGSTCGTIANTAAALFRVRKGTLEAYNNYFNGDSGNVPGYFEAIDAESYVKYNTFANVTKFVHPTAANKLVFDENLYLNAEGVALAAAPAELVNATADVTVASSEEDRAARYQAYVDANAPTVYAITFNANGGTLTSEAPAEYDSKVGIAQLPTVELEGYKFLGWYLNDAVVTEIAVGTKGDLELVAKWEKIVVAVDYNITYNLVEGEWPSTAIESHAAMAEAFMADYSEYITVHSNHTEGLVTPAKFMDVSYLHGNLDDFFDHADYSAKWSWVRTFVTEYCVSTGNQYASNISDKNAEYHNTILRGNVHGFINNGQWASWPKSADYSTVKFEDYAAKLPAGEIVEGPAKYTFGQVTPLVAPVKDGYDFLGWLLNGVLVKEISAETMGDIELTAKWRVASGEEGVLFVGENETYKTIADALVDALPGETIKVAAGNYAGANITVDGITILGPNAGVNPNKETRAEEAIFNEDFIISANNVTIDGIQLTGPSRMVGGEAGISNLVVKNVWSKGCSVNVGASDSNTAPFFFSSSVSGVEYTNLQFIQIRMSDRTDGRPMAMVLDQVNGISIKDSEFIGKRSNYNDAFKMGNLGSYGVKGSFEFVGNYVEGFSQYVLWFVTYAEGNYSIQNNTFKDCGQTSSSHGALRLADYVGADNGVSSVDFLYNTVDSSYMLVRIDADATRTAETQPVKVNYNKLLNCGATYYIKNSNGYKIDGTNNYYDVQPSDSLMLNVAYTPYYANEGDVPLYGQELSFYAIEYVTNGGTLAEGAPTMYDSKVGLASLPAISKANHIFQGWLLNGQVVTEIAAGTTGKVVLEASFREDALYVSKNGEEYAYATIAEALAAAKEGDKIIILAGEWDEAVTVDKAGLTIAGPNQGIDAVNGTRVAEAIIKNVISVDLSATDLTIDGLAFTAGGRVVASATSGTYEGFTFKNNKVYDTNETTTPWVVNRYVMDAVVEFRLKSGGKCKNFEILNNSFVNCSAVNVMVNRPHNLSVDGNLFKNFDQDAFRIAGGYTHGVHAFTNNVFEVENQGDAHTGIFFYSLSGGDAFPRAIVRNNVFKNLGQADSSKFSGALAANFYQEMGLEWDISNNIFDNCYNYMWLRNNGADASNWSSKIENNQFLGLPHDYYYGTYTGTDSETTNPHLNVFGANYYEDNDGNVITDMNTIADKFFHTATIGTALAEKPVYTPAEKYEFWTITYVLDGGTAKNLVTEYNKDTGAIALPAATWNIYHEFAGWEFNGNIVTEIPAGTKGDITVVAKWTEIEGNPVTLNFELNGGNWSYSSFADISADLLADYNNYGGTNYTAATLPTGAWVNINIHTFFYSEGMSEKWGWLAGWLGEVGGSSNKPGCKALLQYSDAASFAAANSNYPYEVSYEFRAIMRGSSITSNSSYKTPDYSVPALNEQIWEPLVKAQKSTMETTEGKILTLPEAHKQYLAFGGWYDNAELTGEPVTTITVGATNPTYYAKYYDANPVTEIKVANAVTEMPRFTTHQLVWEVLPAAAANKGVNFVSSDEKVCTVTPEGLITAVANGTCTIKLISAANASIVTELPITVTVPAIMVGAYETSSVVSVNEVINLTASIKNGEGTVVWSSSDETVATVVDGVVTGVKAGTTTITAKSASDENVKADFIVTVIEGAVSAELQYILDNHNANIYTSYNLGIGSGTPAYYADIYGSVSKILFNHELVINTDYLERGNATGDYYENANLEYEGIQFVTFHYTAGMGATADTDNHASYFTGGSADVSIHYITGNKGTEGYEVYQTLDHKHGAWHAGDSNGRYYSNSNTVDANGWKRFEWIPTGVAYDGSELLDIKWTASQDFYFELNGKKTTIKLPTTYDYKSRNSDHIYNADGTISSQPDFCDQYTWGKPFENREAESFFTDQGFVVKVVDGYYYMAPTWWSYGQVLEGRICTFGGNMNSIGIESCVNEGSDLWLTWQITGQLIAKLLYDNNLTIDRVKGHYFFDGKDCPQPLLENDMEIWYEIIECIKAELDMITTYKNVKFEMVSNNPDIVDNQGRVVNVPTYTTAVSYTVTITNGDKVETITLGSIVPGIYEK